jgi:hypothetical protein
MQQASTRNNLPLSLEKIIRLASDAREAFIRSHQNERTLQLCNKPCKTQSDDSESNSISSSKAVGQKTTAWVSLGRDVACLDPDLLSETYKCFDFRKTDTRAVITMIRVLKAHYISHIVASTKYKKYMGNQERSKQDAEWSFARAAETQISFISNIFETFNIENRVEYATIALKQNKASADRGYLVTINTIFDRNGLSANVLNKAIFDAKLRNTDLTGHSVILMDDIRQFDIHFHRVYEPNVHVVGNQDDIRFVIVVSDLLDQAKNTMLPDNTQEECFSLNKRGLDRLFLGARREASNHRTFCYPYFVGHVGSRPISQAKPEVGSNDSCLPGVLALSDHNYAVEQRQADHIEIVGQAASGPRETLISPTKVARSFFGYRGLRQLDSK